MKETNIINGCLDAFFETGTEGVIWSICDDNKSGYDSLVLIEEGEYLKVYSDDGVVYWEGVIIADNWSNWRSYPSNSHAGKQVSCGMWVHWLQAKVDSDEWGNMFFDGLRAKLNKSYNIDKEEILKLKKKRI